MSFEFHKITMEDKALFDGAMQEKYLELCDYTFTSVLIWAGRYETEVAEWEGCLLIRYLVDGAVMYAYPVSGEPEKRIRAIRWLLEQEKEQGRKLNLVLLTETFRAELIAAFPGVFEIDEFRDGFDYVYRRETLEKLTGRKLAAKRNHIRRFQDMGEWSYKEMEPSDLEECLQLERDWMLRQPEESRSELQYEYDGMRLAFANFERLGLSGGVIHQNGQLVAFSVGERLSEDTYVVHFEKADTDVQGSFQIINQQMAEHHPDFTFFNREDDTGDPGLRKSKLSYHPEFMVRKYRAACSEFTFAEKEDMEDIIRLWQACFSDSREYVENFLRNMPWEGRILCRRDGGKAVSMACLFPAELRCREKYEQVLYLYAVATLPGHRKQGLASSLICHIAQKYGKSLLLSPAGAQLEEYYKKMGFVTRFHGRELADRMETARDNDSCGFFEIILEGSDGVTDKAADKGPEKASAKEPDKAETMEPEKAADKEADKAATLLPEKAEALELGRLTQEYHASRQKRFDQMFYVEWEEWYLRYAILEHYFCGGRILKCFDGFVLLHIKGQEVLIVESTVSSEFEGKLGGLLQAAFGAERVATVQSSGMVMAAGTAEGQICKDGYIALTLG